MPFVTFLYFSKFSGLAAHYWHLLTVAFKEQSFLVIRCRVKYQQVVVMILFKMCILNLTLHDKRTASEENKACIRTIPTYARTTR
jgi:hypothetical protein